MFVKGDPRINRNGRPVGSKDKFAKLKYAWAEAFERMGSVDALYEWAKNHKHEFFEMMVRLLPKDVDLEVTGEPLFENKTIIVRANATDKSETVPGRVPL